MLWEVSSDAHGEWAIRHSEIATPHNIRRHMPRCLFPDQASETEKTLSGSRGLEPRVWRGIRWPNGPLGNCSSAISLALGGQWSMVWQW